MTWEVWLALAVVAIPGTLSLIGQLSGIWAAKDSNVVSDASKLTGSALAMVKGLEKRVERLSLRVEQQDEQAKYQDKQMDTMREAERIMINRIRDLESNLDSTMQNLDVAEDNIKFLLQYISSKGIDVPDLRFRG